jgi:hypothetical protein
LLVDIKKYPNIFTDEGLCNINEGLCNKNPDKCNINAINKNKNKNKNKEKEENIDIKGNLKNFSDLNLLSNSK